MKMNSGDSISAVSEDSIKTSHTEVEFAVRKNDILLQCNKFGVFNEKKTGNTSIVKQFKWINRNNMETQVITYGATITKIIVPDKDGKLEDVVLGFDDLHGYENERNPNIGCTIGRVANRISGGKFMIGGTEYMLEQNAEGHHLHGGSSGFDKKNWVATNEGIKVVMSLVSPDGDGGYPGDVFSNVTFYLDNNNTFHIEMQAISSHETPLNMTNHSYFNLGGHDSGFKSLYEHVLSINADKITVNDCDTVPTGKFQCVGGSAFDFRVPRLLGNALSNTECNGFDNNFCITKGTDQKLCFMARALHPKFGRYLEVYSDQPGLQFYTANSMPDPENKIKPIEAYQAKQTNAFSYNTDDITHLEPVSISTHSTEDVSACDCPSNINAESIKGKGGALYMKHGAFCLEPQKYPDAVNRLEFPSIIIKPGDIYTHNMSFKFGVNK